MKFNTKKKSVKRFSSLKMDMMSLLAFKISYGNENSDIFFLFVFYNKKNKFRKQFGYKKKTTFLFQQTLLGVKK